MTFSEFFSGSLIYDNSIVRVVASTHSTVSVNVSVSVRPCVNEGQGSIEVAVAL